MEVVASIHVYAVHNYVNLPANLQVLCCLTVSISRYFQYRDLEVPVTKDVVRVQGFLVTKDKCVKLLFTAVHLIGQTFCSLTTAEIQSRSKCQTWSQGHLFSQGYWIVACRLKQHWVSDCDGNTDSLLAAVGNIFKSANYCIPHAWHTHTYMQTYKLSARCNTELFASH